MAGKPNPYPKKGPSDNDADDKKVAPPKKGSKAPPFGGSGKSAAPAKGKAPFPPKKKGPIDDKTLGDMTNSLKSMG